MIRSFDEPAGKNPHKFNPRAVLQSLDRHLSQTARVTGKKADAAQQPSTSNHDRDTNHDYASR